MAQPPETHFTIRPDVVKRLTAWMTGDGMHPSYDPVGFEPALKAALDAASAAYEQQFKKVFREPALKAALDAASAAYEQQFKKVFREQYDARRTV